MEVGQDNHFQESHHDSLNLNNFGFWIQILAKF